MLLTVIRLFQLQDNSVLTAPSSMDTSTGNIMLNSSRSSQNDSFTTTDGRAAVADNASGDVNLEGEQLSRHDLSETEAEKHFDGEIVDQCIGRCVHWHQ